MKTGISIPSWMIPNMNMQHFQMPALPQMRLGTDMDMGMRMGMGMMDANAAAVRAGCTLMTMPMYPGQPPTGLSSHSSALQPADHVQAPGLVTAHNFYVAPSQVQVRAGCLTSARGFCVLILMSSSLSPVAFSNEPEYESKYPYVQCIHCTTAAASASTSTTTISGTNAAVTSTPGKQWKEISPLRSVLNLWLVHFFFAKER